MKTVVLKNRRRSLFRYGFAAIMATSLMAMSYVICDSENDLLMWNMDKDCFSVNDTEDDEATDDLVDVQETLHDLAFVATTGGAVC